MDTRAMYERAFDTNNTGAKCNLAALLTLELCYNDTARRVLLNKESRALHSLAARSHLFPRLRRAIYVQRQVNALKPQTPLGYKLCECRGHFAANGGKFMTREQLDEYISQ